MKNIIIILFSLFSNHAHAQSQEDPVWWKMEENGEYLEVTSHLLYKVLSDSTRKKNADYLHISRNYGYLNDYEKAIFYLKKSIEDFDESSDEQYWWYYQGTLAFFQRDKNKLKFFMTKLGEKHSPYYENNYFTLKSLYENFDKGYHEASHWKN